MRNATLYRGENRSQKETARKCVPKRERLSELLILVRILGGWHILRLQLNLF